MTILKAEFGLKKPALAILDYLMERERATADKICGQTNVPLGRIYEHLNWLVKNKLIKKTSGHPAEYYTDDIKANLLDFAHLQHKNLVAKEGLLFSKLDIEEETTALKVLSRDEILAEQLRLFNLPGVTRVRNKTPPPIIFYPEDPDTFIRWREAIYSSPGLISLASKKLVLKLKMAHDFLRSGSTQCQMVTFKTLDLFVAAGIKEFGAEETKKYLSNLLEKIKKHNLKVIVLKKFPEKLPFQMVIKPPIIMLYSHKDTGESVVIKISDKHFCQIFVDIFDEEFKKGTDLKHILPELIAEPKSIKKYV